jgi:flagella basal body P-ring formation protein FlgA
MIRSRIRRMAIVLALACPLASTAAAQTATPRSAGDQIAAAQIATPQSAADQIAATQIAVPALRDSVTVTSDVVRIGDLVENAGPVADVPIFRSPDLGTTGMVSTESVVEAIRPHQLIDIDTRGLAGVTVTRASRPITVQEISARIAEVLSQQCGLGEPHDISVNFDQAVRTLQVEPNATGPLQVAGLDYDPRTARFDITFDLPTSAELQLHPARFTGTAFATVPAVAVDHPVERGDVLKASDLTVVRRPKSEADGGGIREIADAVGLAARHDLRPNQPLHTVDLVRPNIVQRNDTVTIVYEAPGLVLTLRGRAQEAGALGDSIGVLNVESNRVIQGIVSAPGRVTVSAVPTRVVENTPMVVSSPSSPERSE